MKNKQIENTLYLIFGSFIIGYMLYLGLSWSADEILYSRKSYNILLGIYCLLCLITLFIFSIFISMRMLSSKWRLHPLINCLIAFSILHLLSTYGSEYFMHNLKLSYSMSESGEFVNKREVTSAGIIPMTVIVFMTITAVYFTISAMMIKCIYHVTFEDGRIIDLVVNQATINTYKPDSKDMVFRIKEEIEKEIGKVKNIYLLK